MAQVKKLSVATVYGAIDLKKVVNAEKPFPVLEAFGQAVQVKSGESSYGPWTALVGQFRAVNPETGESMDGSTLFLPEVALIPVQVAMANGAATFAIRILCGPSSSKKPGGSPYEYSFEHILPPTEDDPLVRLQKQIDAAKAALPAPDSALEKKAAAKGK